MTINELFNEYLQFKESNGSKGDYEYCNAHLKVIKKYLQYKRIYHHTEIKDWFVDEFIKYKKLKNNSINTINKELQLFRLVLRRNDIHIPCLESFKRIRFKRKSFNILNISELKKLLNYINNYDLTDPTRKTNYLLVYLLLYTGARRTEICNVRIEDIDFDNKAIYLNHTKNGDPRIVFFQKKIVPELQSYIDLKVDREYLFHNFKTNSALTPDNISAIFRYIKKELSLNHLSPHVLRHTMATLLLDHDSDLYFIKTILGHKSLDQTQIYLHTSVLKNKKKYDKYFPTI